MRSGPRRGGIGAESLHDAGLVRFHDVDAAGDPQQHQNRDHDLGAAGQASPQRGEFLGQVLAHAAGVGRHGSLAASLLGKFVPIPVHPWRHREVTLEGQEVRPTPQSPKEAA